MTLAEFVKKWLGKKADFDGAYGAQCVDLYRMYCKEVLQVPQTPPVEGAKDIWDKRGVLKAREGKPEPGDVLVYGESYGKYGHVAIAACEVPGSDTWAVLEQDGYKQDGVKLSLRNLEGLRGALHA